MADESIHLKTDAFEHCEVKPNFINPCCFGEDFAAWLSKELAGRHGDIYQVSDPLQEDYGWGLKIRSKHCRFWVALSYVGDGPTDEPGEWIVSAVSDEGLNILAHLFSKADKAALPLLRERIRIAIEANPDIRILR